MADAVYQSLDRMVPALEDLQIRGLFKADEIRSIVAKRRDFEFLLRRRTARKTDFLRYIEYEMNLDELRRIRKEKAGLKKSTISDFSGRQLIHFIFERALRKFRGDLELWLQYLDYCQSTASNKAHSRALAQALQIFPRTPGLWIRAASYEYFDNASPPAARVLMQRGLRLNGSDSALMWTQYFKLELLYVQKLKGRRMALGIEGEEEVEEEEGKGEEEQENPVDVPRLEGEEGEEKKEDEEDIRAKSVREVLAGAVPRVVYQSAIATRPKDVAMRLACLETLAEIQQLKQDGGGFEALSEEMLAGIEKDMGPEDGAWARALYALKVTPEEEDEDEGGKKKKKKAAPARKRRRRSSSGGGAGDNENEDEDQEKGEWREFSLTAGQKACLLALEKGLAASPSSAKMWKRYIDGLTGLLEAPRGVIIKALARAEKASGPLSAQAYLQWVSLLKDEEEMEEELEREEEIRKILVRAVEVHPQMAALWEARLRNEVEMGKKSGGGSSNKKRRKKDSISNSSEGGVEDVMNAALKALGPEAGMKMIARQQGQDHDDENDNDVHINNRAVADLWLVYLGWLIDTASAQGGDGAEEEEEEEDEEEEERQKIQRKKTRQAFEKAIPSTRGSGRIDICRLWYEWEGKDGLQKALGLMGGGGKGEEGEGLATLCLTALQHEEEKNKVSSLRFLFETILGIVGSRGGSDNTTTTAIWDLYERLEREAGEHRRATNIRWRRDNAK